MLDLAQTLPTLRLDWEPTEQLPSEPLGVERLRVQALDPVSDGPRLLAMCPHVTSQSLYQRFFTSFHRLPAPLRTEASRRELQLLTLS